MTAADTYPAVVNGCGGNGSEPARPGPSRSDPAAGPRRRRPARCRCRGRRSAVAATRAPRAMAISPEPTAAGAPTGTRRLPTEKMTRTPMRRWRRSPPASPRVSMACPNLCCRGSPRPRRRALRACSRRHWSPLTRACALPSWTCGSASCGPLPLITSTVRGTCPTWGPRCGPGSSTPGIRPTWMRPSPLDGPRCRPPPATTPTARGVCPTWGLRCSAGSNAPGTRSTWTRPSTCTRPPWGPPPPTTPTARDTCPPWGPRCGPGSSAPGVRLTWTRRCPPIPGRGRWSREHLRSVFGQPWPWPSWSRNPHPGGRQIWRRPRCGCCPR